MHRLCSKPAAASSMFLGWEKKMAHHKSLVQTAIADAASCNLMQRSLVHKQSQVSNASSSSPTARLPQNAAITQSPACVVTRITQHYSKILHLRWLWPSDISPKPSEVAYFRRPKTYLRRYLSLGRNGSEIKRSDLVSELVIG